MVEVVQADVSDEEHLDRVLAEPRTGGRWDYIINLAAETAHGKSDEMYEKMVTAAGKLAEGAVAGGAKKFVHVSTAQVYKSDGARAAREDAPTAPWTVQAEYMLNSEAAVRGVAGAPFIILRPATIYGPGDATSGLMPRVVVAASYVAMGRAKMELLWEGGLKCNTVHVYDVARAIVFAARKLEAGSTFNLADAGNTDQGKLAAALGRLFGIETGFYGSIVSNVMRVRGRRRQSS